MPSGDRFIIKRGYSLSTNEIDAVSELHDAIFQPDISSVILFCSSKYNLNILGSEIKSKFGSAVVGCTTSGEISQAGYMEGSLSGVSIAGRDLKLFNHFIHPLADYDVSRAAESATVINKELIGFQESHPGAKGFGLLLIDGLSCKEEQVIGHLYNSLKNLPIIGGSAGDDLGFKETFVYYDGKFYSNTAVFTLFATTVPFKIFKSQHFIPTKKRMVITKARPEERIVYEINGKPAAWEYARLVGLEIDKLDSQVFSKYPVVLKISGEYYVRSIQKVNSDESLTFYCAIDEGLVLTLSQGIDFISTLQNVFKEVRETIPDPKLIIGCECVLRRLEILDKGLVDEAARLMRENNVVGFHTYGEQFNAIHVNQTFTGVAIG